MKILPLVTVMMTLVLEGGALGNPAPEPEPAVIRVMTYNIQHGRGMDGVVDLGRIAEVIQRAGADIVALQEVDKGVARTDGRDLAAELAQLTGLRHYFHRNIDYQGGEYGNAVLTRFPMLEATNTHLPMVRPHEQRGVIQMILEIKGRRVLFMNTHIDHRSDDSERLESVQQFQKILAAHPQMPVILAGDFNDRPGSRTHQRLKELLADTWELRGEGDGFTFRADRPDRRIDYLWINTDFIEPLKIWIPPSLASDHLPLVAELRIK